LNSQSHRDLVREKYNIPGADYDRQRRDEIKGNFLSNYDIVLFEEMLPGLEPDMNVLEVGAGTGRFTLPALKKADSVTAVDINESLLESLRVKIKDNGCEDRCRIKVEDMFDLSFDDNTFDFVYSLHVIPRLMTLEDHADALKEITRVIKPGGQLLFNYRNRYCLYGMVHRDFALSPREINTILSDCSLKITQRRGKWLITRSILDILPCAVGRSLAYLDRKLQRFLPGYAWDVFVLATKEDASR